jgi:hypothetical protein
MGLKYQVDRSGSWYQAGEDNRMIRRSMRFYMSRYPPVLRYSHRNNSLLARRNTNATAFGSYRSRRSAVLNRSLVGVKRSGSGVIRMLKTIGPRLYEITRWIRNSVKPRDSDLGEPNL